MSEYKGRIYKKAETPRGRLWRAVSTVLDGGAKKRKHVRNPKVREGVWAANHGSSRELVDLNSPFSVADHSNLILRSKKRRY